MSPLLDIEATGEQLSRELPERLANYQEQRFRVVVTPVEPEMGREAKAPRRLTIEEKIAAIVADIPPEERAKVPADLTDQLDHYIYGLPKK